jgi:hypothetical protein
MTKIVTKFCQACKKEFDSITTEEAKISEMQALFGDLPPEERATVCEPCFIKIMDFNEPGVYRYAKFIEKH